MAYVTTPRLSRLQAACVLGIRESVVSVPNWESYERGSQHMGLVRRPSEYWRKVSHLGKLVGGTKEILVMRKIWLDTAHLRPHHGDRGQLAAAPSVSADEGRITQRHI